MGIDESKKTILILGASSMQIPAITCGRELGWRVVVADGNRDAEGVKLADAFEHVDLKDRDGMVEAARRQMRTGGLDGVFTAGTDFSATVAWVAERLSLPGIPYETALDASDKSRMRGVFDREGLPSPRFTAVSSVEESAAALSSIGTPVVVKPVDSMGARGVRRVDSENALTGAVEEALSHSRTGHAIIEQYIDGPEFSLDAVVYRGSIQLAGIADRHIFFPPYFVEMGHTMPSAFDEDVKKRVIDTFYDGIRALGIIDGAAKGDIKLSGDGPVIGEIAARLSGGYMSGWTYPYSSGVQVTEAAMKIAVGMDPGVLTPDRDLVAAERAFISIPGTITEVTGVETARETVEELFTRVSPGDQVRFPTNNVQKCGNVICVSADRDVAAQRAMRACRGIFLRLKPFDGTTAGFLYGDLESWAPDAYILGVEANKRHVSTAPPYRGAKTAPLTGIVDLPAFGEETAADWHGLNISDGLRRVVDETGIDVIDPGSVSDDGFYPDGLFWRAFLRGGIQGGIWALDSLRELDADGWKLVDGWLE